MAAPTTSWEKYSGAASAWTQTEYADPATYLGHRADVVLNLGYRVPDGATVLDLACGDGALGAYLPAQRYVGVDANHAMVDAARRAGRTVVLGNLNDYRPDAPVEVTTVFRAIYYATQRRELFEHIASYTSGKLVFDLNPRQYALQDVLADLRSVGFGRVAFRPFLIPQTRLLPGATRRAMIALERAPVVSSLLLRRRFTLICAALFDSASTRP